MSAACLWPVGTLPVECDRSARACRVLWLTVINDAVQEYRNKGSRSSEIFLFESPAYFSLLCSLAGVNPEKVQQAAAWIDPHYRYSPGGRRLPVVLPPEQWEAVYR